MEKAHEEIKQEQMEEATGGLITGYTGSPHCTACGCEMTPFGSYYRCKNAGCKERGLNKNPGQVSWY